MELTHFHKLRTGLQCNARPATPADLIEVEFRVWDGLASTGWFADVEVGSTDDLDNLVVAMCTYPAELTEDRIAQRLAQLWQDRLRYPFWGPCTTLVEPDQVELEGATRTSAQGHYVTVHVIAQKAGLRSGHPSVIPPQRSGS